MSASGVACAFSVIQCGAKRSRQLERLLYMLESTAARFQQVKAPHSSSDLVVLASSTRARVQEQYGKLLLAFLEKERDLDIPALFAGAIHLESSDEELQQLLVVVEDEDLLRQRVHGNWAFLAGASINQDIVALVERCERVWNGLMPLASCASPLINGIRGDPDVPSWLRSAEASCSAMHPWPAAG